MENNKHTPLDSVYEMVDKPFRSGPDNTVFVIRRSGSVVWIEEKLLHTEKWAYHCQLFITDNTITAGNRLLDSFNEKEISLNDFIWL
jgi:hypothetical protein